MTRKGRKILNACVGAVVFPVYMVAGLFALVTIFRGVVVLAEHMQWDVGSTVFATVTLVGLAVWGWAWGWTRDEAGGDDYQDRR